MLKLFLPVAMALALVGPALAGPPQVDGDTQFDAAELSQQTPDFKRGEYLPVQYRGDYLEDWEAYGLETPEPGFNWVFIGHKAYLINQTSGLIIKTFKGIKD